MQEVFEKIIEKLKEHIDHSSGIYNSGYNEGIADAIEIVNQVAAEYNNGWIPADEPPKDDNYVLLSFENFSLPLVGRYESDGNGGGSYYIGDCDEEDTCIANDLYVNAWQPLPKPFQPKGEQ